MSTVLVTGAARGIGLELVRAFANRGDDVIAVCRQPSEDLEDLDVRVEGGVDVSHEEAVAALTRRLDGIPIDVLVNNAGILLPDELESLDLDTVTQQMEVNALGPLRVTQHLLGNLEKGSKVALVTSRMGSIADNGSGRMYGYRMSKAALNAAGMSLARDLAPRGIAVILLHPGYVATDMTSHGGDVSPADAAAGLIARIDELTLDSTGSFRHANGETLPW